MIHLQRIISGGQTGADRAALDAAIACDFPHGGFCPRRRAAEDGPIAEHYLLEEITGGYAERTRMNVESADCTVIFYESDLHGGTALTERRCVDLAKPFVSIDSSVVTESVAVAQVLAALQRYDVAVLNVAGPRASSSPCIYDYVHTVMWHLLREIRSC